MEIPFVAFILNKEKIWFQIIRCVVNSAVPTMTTAISMRIAVCSAHLCEKFLIKNRYEKRKAANIDTKRRLREGGWCETLWFVIKAYIV